MKILMLNYEFPPLGGGAGNANYYILKEMAKVENIKIDLVTSSISVFRVEKFSDNITIHYLDIGKNGNLLYQSNADLIKYSYKAYYYSRRLIKKRNFDFIHAFFGIPCGYIAYKLKLPYIISLRGSDVPGHNPYFNATHTLFYFINKKVWKKAKKIISISELLKRTALKTKFTQNIQVIPNGVDCDFFKPDRNKITHGFLNILFVGRLNRIKNIDILIKSASVLDGVILTIAGDGPEAENLMSLVRTLRIGHKVIFLGRKNRDELVNVYQNSDLFILPSISESAGNVVMEAMACGLPLILTHTTGTADLIKGNGYVIDTISVETLTEKINYFIQNKNELIEMGNKSRKIAENFSWASTAKEYEIIYSEIINHLQKTGYKSDK